MKQTNRKGATAVEFALVLPISFAIVLGLMEWGRFEMVRQVTSTAAFNGSRLGSIPGATDVDVEARVNDILGVYFVTGATVTSTFSIEETTVLVQVPMDQNSFFLKHLFGSLTLEREFTIYAD